MGTLKNAVKRKTHKERSQPSDRRKFGLLEKKKDYLQRAKDFHRKEGTLQSARRKAEERNPDEFYHAMQNARTKEGVHQVGEKANKYTQEELRLMKTQDVKHIALQAQAEAKKLERLRSELHFIGTAARNTHTVFVDDDGQAQAFSPEAYFGTPAKLLHRSFNRPRDAQLSEQALTTGGNANQKLKRRQAAAYKELQQRFERHGKMQALAAEMTMQKELMGKGGRRKLKPSDAEGSLPVHKWRQERKR